MKWQIETVMNIVMRHETQSSTHSFLIRSENLGVDSDTLHECLVILAGIIDEDGDCYLPIFERVKTELDRHSHYDSLKMLAKEIVIDGGYEIDSKYCTTFGPQSTQHKNYGNPKDSAITIN